MSGLRKQSAISVSSLTSNSSRPQAFIAPEPASITSLSQNECSIPEEKEEVLKINLIFCFSYHKRKRTDFLKGKEKNGLVFGSNVASSIHNDNEVSRL